MEEALKTFESLSDAEKVKFFQVLTSASSPKKSGVNILLDNLQNLSKEHPVIEIAQPDDLNKRQKTLDSWLIKNNTPKKSKHADSKTVKENYTVDKKTVSENVTCLVEEAICTEKCVNNISMNQACNDDVKAKEDISENLQLPSKDNGIMFQLNNPVDSDTLLGETSTYNLRSKRKNAKLKCIEVNEICTKDLRNRTNFENNISEGINCESDLLIQSPVVDLFDIKDSVSCSVRNFDSDSSLLSGKIDGDSDFICDNLVAQNKASAGDCDSIYEDLAARNKMSYKIKPKKKSSPKPGCSKEINLLRRISTVDANNQDEHVESENNILPVQTSDVSSQFEYEAFFKVKEACLQFGLNVQDLLQHEKIQTVLNDPQKYGSDAILFIGTHKSAEEKVVPVVHIHKSKKLLLENLYKMQNF